MKKFLAFGLVAMLAGCGGSGGSSNPQDSLSINGIYMDTVGTESVLIDSDRGVVFVSEDGFFAVDSASFEVNGLTLTASNSEQVDTMTYSYVLNLTVKSTSSADYTLTMHELDHNMDTTITTTVTGTLERQASSLALADMTNFGTSTLDDSVTYVIDAAGTFTANSACVLSGDMVSKGFYYDITASASSCDASVSDLEGETVQGVAYTLNYNAQDYLIFAGTSSEWMFWDQIAQY